MAWAAACRMDPATAQPPIGKRQKRGAASQGIQTATAAERPRGELGDVIVMGHMLRTGGERDTGTAPTEQGQWPRRGSNPHGEEISTGF